MAPLSSNPSTSEVALEKTHVNLQWEIFNINKYMLNEHKAAVKILNIINKHKYNT